VLEVTDLTAGYDGIVAVRSVSLKVVAGQMACLVGANGAGKTTLLNAISGLVRARRGRIVFDGDDITGRSGHEIARRGLLQVPEGRQIFASLTVEENLRLGATGVGNRAGDTEREMAHVFALFPTLEERRRQVAGQLSGGQQQMLAIGRALLGRPRLLLLDEPSLGLAPNLITQVYEALQKLNRTGLSILVVEQNATRAIESTDYAYVMDRGEIVLEGPSNQQNIGDIVSHYLGQMRTAAPRTDERSGGATGRKGCLIV
jgi:branched-chain amino acid transport system ATP-binding protein